MQFWLEERFVSAKFCDLCMEMVQGQQNLMFDSECMLMLVQNFACLNQSANINTKSNHLKVCIFPHFLETILSIIVAKSI